MLLGSVVQKLFDFVVIRRRKLLRKLCLRRDKIAVRLLGVNAQIIVFGECRFVLVNILLNHVVTLVDGYALQFHRRFGVALLRLDIRCSPRLFVIGFILLDAVVLLRHVVGFVLRLLRHFGYFLRQFVLIYVVQTGYRRRFDRQSVRFLVFQPVDCKFELPIKFVLG